MVHVLLAYTAWNWLDIDWREEACGNSAPVVGLQNQLFWSLSQLEKFKFVLDYKIKELKRQIEPRENEISDMRHQIEEMDLELEQVCFCCP